MLRLSALALAVLCPWISPAAGQVVPAVRADVIPRSQALAAACLEQHTYLKHAAGDGGFFFGKSAAVSGRTLAIASEGGGVHVLVMSGGLWSPQAYLQPSVADPFDSFGGSVAISGDTIVVGAYREDSAATGVDGDALDNGAEDSGAAYVFVRTGTTWTQQAYLKASNTGADDYFGWSVAVSGDVAVIGAPDEDARATGVNGDGTDDSVPREGAAYAFVRSGETWSQEAYLKAPHDSDEQPQECVDIGGFVFCFDVPGDNFGLSVGLSGDTAIVGARWEDSNAVGVNGPEDNNFRKDSGAAYVFTRSGSSWSQEAFLKASNPGGEYVGMFTFPGDMFGSAVAISGDVAVVGSPLEGSSATGVNGDQTNSKYSDYGAAYVFVRSGTTWIQDAYLKATTQEPSFEPKDFGLAVAVNEGLIAVGSPGVDDDTGAVEVYAGSPGSWAPAARLTASNGEPGDEFGGGVAVQDWTVIAGAPVEASGATGIDGDQSDNSAPSSGAAYLFSPTGDPTPSLEVLRIGSPPNPAALLPGLTSGPVPGATWDPVIDHTTFAPTATLDLLAITLSPANTVLPPYGTLLCQPPKLGPAFTSSPGEPFSVPIPYSCSFVGLTLCTQGISTDGGGGIFLTNAIDITFGTL